MTITPRPKNVPKKIPLWAWHLDAWMSGGRKGPRPADAPKNTPLWFWKWRIWELNRAKHAHKKHVKKNPPTTLLRKKEVKHAKWGALPSVSPKMHYTEDSRRDDWLVNNEPSKLPQWTDCSGWVSESAYVAGAPDPSGLDWRFLGYTGTLLDHAYKTGKVITVLNGDASAAKEGDDIVIGPGTGWHVVKVVKAGKDPIVSTHGGEGVQLQLLSVDTREPKRICQVLPV